MSTIIETKIKSLLLNISSVMCISVQFLQVEIFHHYIVVCLSVVVFFYYGALLHFDPPPPPHTLTCWILWVFRICSDSSVFSVKKFLSNYKVACRFGDGCSGVVAVEAVPAEVFPTLIFAWHVSVFWELSIVLFVKWN